MVDGIKDAREERQQRLRYALDTIGNEAIDLDALKKKIAGSKTSWLVAELFDGLASRYPAKPLPTEFTVMATDGSHIDVDRHRSTRCYLINIGSAVIHYGASPTASLDSSPTLYSGDEDLVIMPSAGDKGREQFVEGTLLGIKRAVEECRRLTVLARELPPAGNGLALLDGSLMLWGLEGFPDFVNEALLIKGFLSCLDELKSLNNDKKLALASYISFPRSTDVVNVLRLAICPYESANCENYCPPGKPGACEAVAGVRDRDLFHNLLGEGERSALFGTSSKIVKKHYGVHNICFFYLRVDDEVARVEVPQWVAQDEGLLNLVHSLVLDQCRRGQGYPVTLSESHELAVVTGADREKFWQMVETSLTAEHLPTGGSAKSMSKRTRWV